MKSENKVEKVNSAFSTLIGFILNKREDTNEKISQKQTNSAYYTKKLIPKQKMSLSLQCHIGSIIPSSGFFSVCYVFMDEFLLFGSTSSL